MRNPNIVNKKEAMKIYHIGPALMGRYLNEPTCPAIKEGKGWLINIDAFWPWLMKRKEKGETNEKTRPEKL